MCVFLYLSTYFIVHLEIIKKPNLTISLVIEGCFHTFSAPQRACLWGMRAGCLASPLSTKPSSKFSLVPLSMSFLYVDTDEN